MTEMQEVLRKRQAAAEMTEANAKAAESNNTCRSCGAPVLWVRAMGTGEEEGWEQFALDARPAMRYVSVETTLGVTIVELVPTYIKHFDVCPKHQGRRSS